MVPDTKTGRNIIKHKWEQCILQHCNEGLTNLFEDETCKQGSTYFAQSRPPSFPLRLLMGSDLKGALLALTKLLQEIPLQPLRKFNSLKHWSNSAPEKQLQNNWTETERPGGFLSFFIFSLCIFYILQPSTCNEVAAHHQTGSAEGVHPAHLPSHCLARGCVGPAQNCLNQEPTAHKCKPTLLTSSTSQDKQQSFINLCCLGYL